MNSNFGRILVICRSLLVELICYESDRRPTRLQEEGKGKREVQVQEKEEDEQLRPEGRKKLFTG